jgi:CheY-like chemotaxis protein/signal transduction histidine kinase
MLNRLKIGTKIGAGFTLGIALFAAIAAISYRSISQLIDASKWEAHTYQVLGQLEELNAQLKDAETGQRGYLITNEKRYLEPYEVAKQELGERLRVLRDLTADNPDQQKRLSQLAPLVAARLQVMQDAIDIRQEQGFEVARQYVLTDRGRQLMQSILKVIDDMKTEEHNLLRQRSDTAQAAAQTTLSTLFLGVPAYSILLILIGYSLTRHISMPLGRVSKAAEQLGDGDLSVVVPDSDRQDEVGVLSRAFNEMIYNLRETTRRNDEQNWLKSNLAELTQRLQGQRDQETVARLILSHLSPLIGAQQGVFYWFDHEGETPLLRLLSGYAYQKHEHLGNQFQLGEGLIGQCALEKRRILLTDVPSGYFQIVSGLGEAPPQAIVVLPILFEQEVVAVIEFASFQPFHDIHIALLDQIGETIGITLNTIAANTRTAQLLKQSQILTEELQQQKEELRTSNQQLEEQANALQTSEILLKQQQEELQQTNEELQQLNEELEEKAELLMVQKREVESKNKEIEKARQAVEEKAEQLALSSKYKSEFLANMSHELRTPLNSLLILARLLSENGDGNLTSKQVEYSRTIYSAGHDLLLLINDILDLAKIESGTVITEDEQIFFEDLRNSLQANFEQVARNKGLEFRIELAETLPTSMRTDPRRLQQILKNLLANAFKFTEQGSVIMRIEPRAENKEGFNDNLATALSLTDGHASATDIAFSVIDTGIGIPSEKQKVIFEAFQQADGTTSRKYGGTGLGLSISRELTHLLGGKLELHSQPGQGSTFTLRLPRERFIKSSDSAIAPLEAQAITPLPTPIPQQRSTTLGNDHPQINDDRHRLQPGDRILLIIEDDLNFARILMEMAQQRNFKVLIAPNAQTGLAFVHRFQPAAITLDIRLPDMDGWAVLHRLKQDTATRHIPIHILSVDDEQQRSLQSGAIAYLQKPVSLESLNQALTHIKQFIERQVKTLLIVEDDRIQAQSIQELIGNSDVQTVIATSGAEALNLLQQTRFDCLVLDLGLPDMSGFHLIEQIKQQSHLLTLPIIVYTGKELTRQEETQLRRLAETIIIKDVRSPERLLDETALFLHRIQTNLPQPNPKLLDKLHKTDPVLAHRKILIVDDDVRNIFALTALLEQYEMQVLFAENGRDAITTLQTTPDIDLILMDVMMPELDGYETTRCIRQQESFKSLPIIALTAKAMQSDREKCLEAGASDYITKPVDPEQLLSLMRVWLYR